MDNERIEFWKKCQPSVLDNHLALTVMGWCEAEIETIPPTAGSIGSTANWYVSSKRIPTPIVSVAAWKPTYNITYAWWLVERIAQLQAQNPLSELEGRRNTVSWDGPYPHSYISTISGDTVSHWVLPFAVYGKHDEYVITLLDRDNPSLLICRAAAIVWEFVTEGVLKWTPN